MRHGIGTQGATGGMRRGIGKIDGRRGLTEDRR